MLNWKQIVLVEDIPEEIREHSRYADRTYWLRWAGICEKYILIVIEANGTRNTASYEPAEQHRWKQIGGVWTLEAEQVWQGTNWKKKELV